MNGPKDWPGQRGRAETGPGSAEASNLKSDSTTVVRFPRGKWLVPMRLAQRIGRTPVPMKPKAVHCWRVSVQAALGAEVGHV